MGRSKPTAADLKRDLIAELDSARAALSVQSRLAKVELSPAAMVQRSVSKHKIAWIAGGVITGLILVRLLLPPKFRSDKSASSDTKRGFSSIMRGLAFGVAQRAAMNFAKDHLKSHAQTYIDSFLNRKGPDHPSHVASA